MTRQRESCSTQLAPASEAPNHHAATRATCAADAEPSPTGAADVPANADARNAADEASSSAAEHRAARQARMGARRVESAHRVAAEAPAFSREVKAKVAVLLRAVPESRAA